MCALITSIAISLVTGVVASVISGYVVGRYFEFRLVIQRACYSMRLFARDIEAARNTLDELQMARDHLVSQGFVSAEAPINTLIEWAQKHMGDQTIEVEGKRSEMMPLLERLRPSIREVLRVCI